VRVLDEPRAAQVTPRDPGLLAKDARASDAAVLRITQTIAIP